jgi:hypothetical protein
MRLFPPARPGLARLSIALLAIATVLWSGPALAAGFRFHPPEGFVDLSPGAPDERFEGLPPEIVEEARLLPRGFYAANAAGAGDGFVERFVATFLPLGAPDSRRLLAQVIGAFESRPGYRILEAGTVEVGGLLCPRLVLDFDLSGERMRVLAYAFPGETEMALVLASAAPEQFGYWLPIFDRSMQATEGGFKRARRSNPTPFVAVAATLIGFGLVLWIRGRRPQADQAPRES